MSEERDGGEHRPVERDRIIDALCEHYAEDRIGLEEFERRVERAHRARTRDELRSLLSDLPALAGQPLAKAGGESGREVALPPGVGKVHPSRVPERQTEIAIWSGKVRKGSWVPARTIRAFACMGGVELDFREALLPPGEIRVHAGALMGGVEILVPPGVRVETDGFAFLGGFEEDTDASGPVGPDTPVIRVSGFAMLGAVEIMCRHPGESARDARRRRKEETRRREDERRERRRLGGGS